MTIYISGPMTGIENYNKEAFNSLQKKIDGELGMSCTTLNPVEIAASISKSIAKANISEDSEKAYQEFLKADIIALICEADAILMLDGWENSKGAKLEHDVASACGLLVFYSYDELEKYLKCC